MEILITNQKSAYPNFKGSIESTIEKMIMDTATKEKRALTKGKYSPLPFDNKKITEPISKRAEYLINAYNAYMGKHHIVTGLDMEIEEMPLNLAKRAVVWFSNPYADKHIKLETPYFAYPSGLEVFERILDWLSFNIPPERINNAIKIQILDKINEISQLLENNKLDKQAKKLVKAMLDNERRKSLEFENLLRNYKSPVSSKTSITPINNGQPRQERNILPKTSADILEIIATNGKITMNELSQAIPIDKILLKKFMKTLIAEGKIVRHGSTKGSYYTIAEK